VSLVVSVSLPSLSQTSSQDLNRESEQPQSGTHRAYVCGFKVLSKSDPNLAGDYGGRVLESVRSKWYPPILELRESTALQRGTTFVAFEIRGDGSLAKVKVAQSSGTRTLDGIAKQAIVSSAPFARSPGVSGRKELKLQMYFSSRCTSGTTSLSALRRDCATVRIGALIRPRVKPFTLPERVGLSLRMLLIVRTPNTQKKRARRSMALK